LAQRRNSLFNTILFSSRLSLTKHPNTYTLSKALAEELLFLFSDKIPIVIVRPSQIYSSVNEPFGGYIEGMNSGLGIACGRMTGLVRTVFLDTNVLVKCTPVDFVINATITSVWKRAKTSNNNLLIFNCSDYEENPITWRMQNEIIEKHMTKYVPYESLFWYPRLDVSFYTKNLIWHKLSLLLFQIIPAVFIDVIRLFAWKKSL
jgi:alcohol-forming fatty acyl-CoA reductase